MLPLKVVDRRPQKITTSFKDVDKELLFLMNLVRQQNGSPPLKSHIALLFAAKVHAQDMSDNDELSHYGITTYSTWADRCLDAGFPGANLETIRENVAAGQNNPKQLISDYSQSPGHWETILDCNMQYVGSAVSISATGNSYWCNDFGKIE